MMNTGQAGAPEPAGLRVMLAALCCQKGDWEANLTAHREVLARAREAGCQLAVFPEMSLSGSAERVNRRLATRRGQRVPAQPRRHDREGFASPVAPDPSR